MDIKNTNQIKGIFVWMIFTLHYTKYYKNYIYKYRLILNYLGPRVVSLFFFYSSFGIYESIKNKGINYIKTLPKKIIRIKITLKKYLLSIIFKNAIGNSNWFAFTILTLYFYSYVSFLFIENKGHFFFQYNYYMYSMYFSYLYSILFILSKKYRCCL